MRILIVDDDKIFLDKIKKILTLDQHSIVTSISGENALLELEKNEFDLILTDLKMPGLSGVDLIKKIREKGIDIIIIVITGYGSIESAVESMKSGAYDYILKPFEITTLKNKLKEVETELKLKQKPVLINPVFNELIKLVLHPVRKEIITILKTEIKLNFDEIYKKLKIDNSINLNSHINRLIRENVIKKDQESYSLSPTGIMLVDFVSQLENLSHSYPSSQ